MPKIDLASLAGMVQQYISRKYAAALIDRTKVAELKAYIAQYLYDTGFTVDGYTEKTLADRLYSEMAEYSVLTHYLDDPDVEEININGWDDIAITHLDGRIEKTKEHFFSPQHAEDVVKKLLQHSGMIIDNASPLAQGHLPNNTRITAVKKPVVDEERAIAVSIRKLYPQRVDRDNLIRTNTLTEEMLGFLETCIRYGVSFVVAGRTSSGKTTLLNALLAGIPDNKRIYTIESGARELSLVKRNGAGEVMMPHSNRSASKHLTITMPNMNLQDIFTLPVFPELHRNSETKSSSKWRNRVLPAMFIISLCRCIRHIKSLDLTLRITQMPMLILPMRLRCRFILA